MVTDACVAIADQDGSAVSTDLVAAMKADMAFELQELDEAGEDPVLDEVRRLTPEPAVTLE